MNLLIFRYKLNNIYIYIYIYTFFFSFSCSFEQEEDVCGKKFNMIEIVFVCLFAKRFIQQIYLNNIFTLLTLLAYIRICVIL